MLTGKLTPVIFVPGQVIVCVSALRRASEIGVENSPIDRRKAIEVGDGHPLIHLVHRLAHEAEFHDGTFVHDKTRVGGAAGRGKFRLVPVSASMASDTKFHKGVRRRQECDRVGRLKRHLIANVVAGCLP